LPPCAPAETYPSRPVRIIVGYAAGGGVDISARLISERLGQQFIVENRPGAATNIATEAVVRSPADGYTLLLINAANAIPRRSMRSSISNYYPDLAHRTA
jgi:tripartite-type tricarboxylate transporter receptor subunit TctC